MTQPPMLRVPLGAATASETQVLLAEVDFREQVQPGRTAPPLRVEIGDKVTDLTSASLPILPILSRTQKIAHGSPKVPLQRGLTTWELLPHAKGGHPILEIRKTIAGPLGAPKMFQVRFFVLLFLPACVSPRTGFSGPSHCL